MALTLLIADDNDLFVNALEGLLEGDSSIRVVAGPRTARLRRSWPPSSGPTSS